MPAHRRGRSRTASWPRRFWRHEGSGEPARSRRAVPRHLDREGPGPRCQAAGRGGGPGGRPEAGRAGPERAPASRGEGHLLLHGRRADGPRERPPPAPPRARGGGRPGPHRPRGPGPGPLRARARRRRRLPGPTPHEMTGAAVRAVDVIARKRDGGEVPAGELRDFVLAYARQELPDYQMAAFLMAGYLRGFTRAETEALTDAMVDSGDRLDLSRLSGPTVDKHSTGGVADGTTLVVGPLAAALGMQVIKLSGRGLGHTGGTLDKLESIPGFRVGLSIDEFKRNLRDIGACIIGQTASLVPADKILYALRDVTATVESIPLIASSIMSKKIAEGSNALVLDVKCGDGAFMKDRAKAQGLAEAMVAIGARAGVRTEAVLTDMDAPLGRAVGNALEIAECLDTLKAKGPADLTGVVTRLAARMIVLA